MDKANSIISTKPADKTNGRENVHSSSIFFRPFLQTKLTVNQPGDEYEQEADAMADKVMRMKDSSSARDLFFKPGITPVQRKCAHCEEEEKRLQRKENTAGAIIGASTEAYINALSGGRALDENQRSFFEPRLGYDFSDVRVHDDAPAHQSSKDINALAYTHGNHIVFGENQYQQGSNEAKHLLAHELVHVVQQQSNKPANDSNSPVIRRKGDEKTKDYQLPGWFNDKAAKTFYADQVAAVFFPSGKYVPEADDYKVIGLIAKNYSYTAKRLNGLKIKLIGHADDTDFSKMSNDELSLQRARWIASGIKAYFRDGGVPESWLTVETEGTGSAMCKSDPACYKDHDPSQMAMQRRVDIIIDAKQLPVPETVECPPKSLITTETLSEYIDLVKCAEQITKYDSRTMLSLLRQLYYGSNSWSATINSFWDQVIPCKVSFSKSPMAEFDSNLFNSLQRNQIVEGKDIGHVFTGLEAMVCPQEVVISKSKFGVGMTLPTSISNELFATWIGDLGSSLGQYVACFKMQGDVPDDVMKDDCHIEKNTADELAQKLNLPYYFQQLSSSTDLEGDIDGFVIRAAENGIPCKDSEQKPLNLQFPVSGILRQYYFNTNPVKNDKNRFSCFAEVIGAQVSGNKITNKGDLNKKYREQVSNFAQLYYAKNVKISGSHIPSGLSLELINKHDDTILNIFWNWIERRMI